LKGQTFPILKARRVSGIDTLILCGSSRSTFAVPRSWTDRADPSPWAVLDHPPPILDAFCLFDLHLLLQQLASKGGIDS
jgi:hypothetical protein